MIVRPRLSANCPTERVPLQGIGAYDTLFTVHRQLLTLKARGILLLGASPKRAPYSKWLIPFYIAVSFFIGGPCDSDNSSSCQAECLMIK